MTIERLGKYEIRGTLGKGAMGTVYAAWDPIISRQVAIKTVRLPEASDIDAQEELARFKREAQAAGRLTHPNIVGIFDYGESDEVAYIVMEFVDGRTLKSVLDAEERMPVATVGKIMADLLAGLRYSHERGVVHRDIKPANVMIVGGDGHGSGQAKIADFGIARIESSNLTQAGTIMGTPAYMSPEQFMGQVVDRRSDIYSTGVLLFQLLTGERPFEGSMATIMHKALNTSPPKPSELSVTAPVALDAVVARAMARRPDDRFPDAAAFAEAVADAVEGRAPAATDGLAPGLGELFDSEATVVRSAERPSPVPADKGRPATAMPRARSKAPLLAGAAVLALAAAGAGGAWWSGLIGAPEPPNPQIAGGTRTVNPPGNTQGGVVAVQPPSSQDVSRQAEANPNDTTPPKPAETAANPLHPPPPRTDVTQVVPPTTSRTDDGPRTAQVIPPASGTPAGNTLGGTATPPAATNVSPVETRRTDIASTVPLEPATVTPPPNAITNPATVAPPPPDQLASATTNPDPASVTPLHIRSPEPPVVTSSPPTQAIVPPETSAQETTASPTNPPVLTAALVSPEALRRAVTSAVQGADCAAVRGDLTRAGTVSMQGVIGSGGPTQELMRRVRDVAPNATLDWTVEEVNGPYCGALDLVRAYTRPFGSVSGGMEVGLRDGRTNLREDDRINIIAQMPAYAAYLQVDYFSTDGTVYHVQNSMQGGPTFPARSTQSYSAFEVAGPFGTDLLVSIASSMPLFSKGQSLATDAEPYLRQLRAAIDGATKRRAEISAGTVVVHTSPKS